MSNEVKREREREIEERILRKAAALRRKERRKFFVAFLMATYVAMAIICIITVIHIVKDSKKEVNITIETDQISDLPEIFGGETIGDITLNIETVETLTITEIDTINIGEANTEYVIREVDDEQIRQRIEELNSVKLFDVPLDEDVQKYIYAVAEEYNVDAALIVAIIDWESEFDPNARSASGDSGYMQVNDCNLKMLERELGITNIFDPYQNILGGTYILSCALNSSNNELQPGLMVYNMGIKNARKLWKGGTYSSNYSRNVYGLYLEYLSY